MEGIATIESITELDLIVTQDPTNVWLLRDDVEVDDLKLYEQWEKGRPFKAKAVYHHPSGDDFYLKNIDDPFGVRDIDTSRPTDNELDLAPERPGKRYKLMAGETVYDVARRHKLSPTALLDHNEIQDAKAVKAGHWLYIPTHKKENRRHIEYRLLDDPRPMHVAHIGGITKYSFGNVKKWTDIKADLKQYNEGHNVDIVAVAKVPVEDTVAAYYMDRHDLGDYRTTNRVAYTRGFNWQHLAEGHITIEKPASKAEEVAASAMLEEDRPSLPETQEIAPEPVPEPEVAPEPIEEPTTTPLEAELDEYKTTFKYLNHEESPERYRILEDTEIRELDGARPPINRKADSAVMISGWFVYKGTPYYRVATRYWYAIPTQLAYSVENDPFNDFTVDLKDRITYGGALTREERQVARMARLAAKYNRIKTLSGLLRRK